MNSLKNFNRKEIDSFLSLLEKNKDRQNWNDKHSKNYFYSIFDQEGNYLIISPLNGIQAVDEDIRLEGEMLDVFVKGFIAGKDLQQPDEEELEFKKFSFFLPFSTSEELIEVFNVDENLVIKIKPIDKEELNPGT